MRLDSAVFVPTTPQLSRVTSGTLLGLSLLPITVEVASRRGPAHFQLAGLAEAAVREARVRVSSAVARLGVALDEYALTVSLAPADVKKGGAGLDLALAVAILEAVGHVPPGASAGSLIVGELGLDGAVRPIPGLLPLLEGARKLGLDRAFIPAAGEHEGAHAAGIAVHPTPSLTALVDHLCGRRALGVARSGTAPGFEAVAPDLADVRGQGAVKRALVIAASGLHHLLLLGPPGTGKSLLARRLIGLLPPLTLEQALETTAIHSVAGLVDSGRGIVSSPPFRAPHHTVSDVGLVGGGRPPRPGELSLAHHGVLFLDELPEFRRSALEALRQPLEDHAVHIARAGAHVVFPAHPLLVLAMNPCPCGHFGSPRGQCRCAPPERAKYLGKLSGPLLDRIDLHVHVPPIDLAAPSASSASGATSAALRQLVHLARARQAERAACGLVQASSNSLLSLDELERVAVPARKARQLLSLATEKLNLSARAYVRVLRVARTIADLEGSTELSEEHVGEAIRYRTFDGHTL